MVLSKSARRVATAIIGASLIALSSTPFAGDAPTAPLKRAPVPSLDASAKESRERMATVYEQMAACLRSQKPLSECHSEMLKHCQAIMGSQGCTRMRSTGGMMGMGCGMKGMGQGLHGRMTSNPPSSPPK
jgi:hypothetical protein